MVEWERTVMKHKLQSNDFLKNENNEKKKKSLWFAFFGVCTVFYLLFVLSST